MHLKGEEGEEGGEEGIGALNDERRRKKEEKEERTGAETEGGKRQDFLPHQCQDTKQEEELLLLPRKSDS